MTTLQFCNALIREGNAQGSFMHSMTAQKTKQGYNLLNHMGQTICNIRYRGKTEVYRVGLLSLFAIRFPSKTVTISEEYAEIQHFCRTKETYFKAI